MAASRIVETLHMAVTKLRTGTYHRVRLVTPDAPTSDSPVSAYVGEAP